MIHQVIEGRVLSQIIPLPQSMHDMLVEITVAPAVEKTKPALTRSMLRDQLSGSKTESLSGILQLPDNLTLEDLRAERLKKYECSD